MRLHYFFIAAIILGGIALGADMIGHSLDVPRAAPPASNEMPSLANFERLPPELIFHIMDRLQWGAAGQLGIVNSRLAALFDQYLKFHGGLALVKIRRGLGQSIDVPPSQRFILMQPIQLRPQLALKVVESEVTTAISSLLEHALGTTTNSETQIMHILFPSRSSSEKDSDRRNSGSYLQTLSLRTMEQAGLISHIVWYSDYVSSPALERLSPLLYLIHQLGNADSKAILTIVIAILTHLHQRVDFEQYYPSVRALIPDRLAYLTRQYWGDRSMFDQTFRSLVSYYLIPLMVVALVHAGQLDQLQYLLDKLYTTQLGLPGYSTLALIALIELDIIGSKPMVDILTAFSTKHLGRRALCHCASNFGYHRTEAQFCEDRFIMAGSFTSPSECAIFLQFNPLLISFDKQRLKLTVTRHLYDQIIQG
ncbi:hypothetical protein H4R33_003982 [Dimargaris cristalligena]|nr:hypothetical protein H4R33_003982 [Dimargaris cristalligena]